MEIQSTKLGEKILDWSFTFPLAFSQPQSALYGDTWIYVSTICVEWQCHAVLCVFDQNFVSHIWVGFLTSAQECLLNFSPNIMTEIPKVFFFYSPATKSTNNFDIIYTHFFALISPHANCRCLSRWNLMRAGALCPVLGCGFVTLWYLCWWWGQATSLCLCGGVHCPTSYSW